jgi:hypothetical protein
MLDFVPLRNNPEITWLQLGVLARIIALKIKAGWCKSGGI